MLSFRQVRVVGLQRISSWSCLEYTFSAIYYFWDLPCLLGFVGPESFRSSASGGALFCCQLLGKYLKIGIWVFMVRQYCRAFCLDFVFGMVLGGQLAFQGPRFYNISCSYFVRCFISLNSCRRSSRVQCQLWEQLPELGVLVRDLRSSRHCSLGGLCLYT